MSLTDPHQCGFKRSVAKDARNHGPAIEIYFSHRYFAITDDLFPAARPIVATLDWPALEALAKLIPTARSSKANSGQAGADNSAIAFRKGISLCRAGMTFEETSEALCSDPEARAWYRERRHCRHRLAVAVAAANRLALLGQETQQDFGWLKNVQRG